MNESGRGASSEVPAEIRGWNWGAFLLSWIWGIGNATARAAAVRAPRDAAAKLAFDVEGPKARGTAYVSATKDKGEWIIDELEVEVDGREQRIRLMP